MTTKHFPEQMERRNANPRPKTRVYQNHALKSFNMFSSSKIKFLWLSTMQCHLPKTTDRLRLN